MQQKSKSINIQMSICSESSINCIVWPQYLCFCLKNKCLFGVLQFIEVFYIIHKVIIQVISEDAVKPLCGAGNVIEIGQVQKINSS